MAGVKHSSVSAVKKPLKIRKCGDSEDKGYGQKLKRRREMKGISNSKLKPTTDEHIQPIHVPVTVSPSKELSGSIEYQSKESHLDSDEIEPLDCSTPNKPKAFEQNNESLYEELLQGLCEEDLSVSYNHSSLNISHRDNTTHGKLDSLLDDALFDVSISEQDTNPTTELKHTCSGCPYPVESFYGLPLKVLDCLKEFRRISKLYEWQDICLNLQSIRNGGNLVYSLPTSGGKTLVAEILILQQLLLKKKDVLFVLPFVSIVQEKVRELLPFAEALNFAVEEYAGNRGKIPPRRRLSKKVVYVATIEKANGLVNTLIEQDRLGSLGLAVIDELHMLGEGGKRGATLEACLTKILYATTTVQVIAMSATLSNTAEVARFLRAEVYSSTFRPVQLREYIKLGRCVYSYTVSSDGTVDLIPDRTIETILDKEGDIDQISCLVKEVIPSSPCLVFCSTRKNCENVALMLIRCLPRSLKEHCSSARTKLLYQLNIEAAGLCPVLAKTVPWGIAYHHSGLTADERKLIEEAYLDGVLCVITCTSTLAAGVNLPAMRVIVRCPLVGRDFMSRSQYKQMVGRAGRSGYSDTGESIVVIQPQHKTKVLSNLIQGPYDTCSSSLLSTGTDYLKSLLLSVIALKMISNSADMLSFIKCTFLYQQQSDHTHLLATCEEALSQLSSSQYISLDESTEDSNIDTISITNLGRAVHKGCIDVSIAADIYSDFIQSLNSIVLSSDLHLLYLIVPRDMMLSIQPNWTVYFEIITGLEECEMGVVKNLKINLGHISRRATGATGSLSHDAALQYIRFYLALMLHYLLKYSSAEGVWLVADKFQCSRGFVQSLIQQSSSFSSCLIHFTEELPELKAFHLLLPLITQRLSYTVTINLIPLMEIQGMKQGRARQLYAIGVKSPQDMVNCEAEDLCDKLDHLHIFQARKLIKSAKTLLREKLEMLQEDVHEIECTLIPEY